MHTDLNCLSVMQYAIEALKVKHVVVCGHYGCGGVCAALDGVKLGLIENWLRHIQDAKFKHAAHIDALPEVKVREDRMCELNVVEQVLNVCRTTIVRDAWERGQELTVHGAIYSLEDGYIKDLGVTITVGDSVDERYQAAVTALKA